MTTCAHCGVTATTTDGTRYVHTSGPGRGSKYCEPDNLLSWALRHTSDRVTVPA